MIEEIRYYANKIFLFYSIILFIFLTGYKCSNDDNEDNNSNPIQLSFPGIGDYGIFDPSLANDPDGTRIWMSYSEVDNSTWSDNKQINTRLAFSDNSGLDWSDSGTIINQSTDIALPNNVEGTWVLGCLNFSRNPNQGQNIL